MPQYLFLIKLQLAPATLFKKETLAQVSSCEFCEISKNTSFTEYLWATAFAFLTSSDVKCYMFCKKDNHYSNQSKIITDVKLRSEFLKKNHLCFNCFKSGHSKKNCKNNTRCYHCKGNHNTALCYQS